MNTKSFELPRTGDFIGWRIEVWDEGGEKQLFSITQKISGSELAIARGRGSIVSDEDALERLRKSMEEFARERFETGNYSLGQEFSGFWSPR